MTIGELRSPKFSLGPIAMGCATLGMVDMGDVNLKEAKKAVRRAVEVGVSAFDTADIYGLGRGETELSDALGADRHNAFIITKFGVRWKPPLDGRRAVTFRDCSPQYMIEALENSLRRLRVEAIPLYFIHWPDKITPLEDILLALERAKKDGKIVNYGLSNFDTEDIQEAVKSVPIAAIQDSFSLVEDCRTPQFYRDIKSLGVSIFTYGSLAQGLLSGKFTPDSKFGDNDRRARLPQFKNKQWQKNQHILEAVEKIATKRSVPLAQVAIRWVLDSGVSNVVVVGAKSTCQLDTNVGTLDWSLEDDELAVLNNAFQRRKDNP